MKPALTFAALILPTAALAHPGSHGGFGLGGLWTHIVSQPDHVAMALGALVIGAALTWRVWSRK